ncbi:hypothetical protein CupriaWKF_05035 [Cupriavidus sp. WKF15]|uniref:hypothetical protein n=1 Tax=Cupriavidus sp. WKF15 TaxID=3032282 RepID=UPI0023E180B0|nr:hypothetical protein [Cupriavidus sp. WKF15]WER46946.1 hypothetical protein CupriaWKF_05035 [Cupriavidus sp. WKF15]
MLVFWAGEAVALSLMARLCLGEPGRYGPGGVFSLLICVAWLGALVLLIRASRGWWSWTGQSCSAVLPSPQRYGMPRVVVRRPGAGSETAIVTGSWNIGGILLLCLAYGPGRRRGLLVLPFQARSSRVVRMARLALASARAVQPAQSDRERYC